MCDKLVYDLAQEVEGSPSVFVRKDWINILDNQNQNYTANQSVLDTSQLSNSNKYMSYRESYFSVPFIVTMATNINTEYVNCTAAGNAAVIFNPTNPDTSSDMAVGLKNWYGNIIHSFTVDYNGSTIIQQTPFVNMWNSFKLVTSLSYNDLITQGAIIGFYPDDAQAFEFYQPDQGSAGDGATSALVRAAQAPPATQALVMTYPGTGSCNNTNSFTNVLPSTEFQHFRSGHGNIGFNERLKYLTFDTLGVASGAVNTVVNPSVGATYGSLLQGGYPAASVASTGTLALNALWKGYIIKKQAQVTPATNATPGVIQYAIVATIYLKHVHSFFNMIPLLKGVFMKMTMNLNNVSCSIVAGATVTAAGAGAVIPATKALLCSNVSSALGGSNMLMIGSNQGNNGGANLLLAAGATPTINANGAGLTSIVTGWRVNLSVGASCLDPQILNLPNAALTSSPLSRSIYLYIPAYTFNPTFEQAYLSSPVKQIKYSDIYQYQVLGVPTGNTFNNLLTNGINNVKSVLILPFFSSSATSGATSTFTPAAASGFVGSAAVSLSTNTGFTSGYPVYTSPFDCAGCGTTSPLSHITNFNVQVSGQNAIYNLQKYGFEQFNNQLYGQNAVNGGMTDGITSGLIGKMEFDLKYCYYYVNIERMLPVEQSVPKSIQILGTNLSSRAMDYVCFIEYGTEISIDTITGARV
jgi:hypothetical protein